MTSEYALRPATADDEDFLAKLFVDVHCEDLGAAGLPPAMLAQLLDVQYRGQRLTYDSRFPSAESSIICAGQERIGRLLVDKGASEMRLVDIALLASHRGRGLGTQIIGSLCDKATLESCPLRLSVRQGSAAQRLYLRCGFVPTGGDPMQVEMEFRATASR